MRSVYCRLLDIILYQHAFQNISVYTCLVFTGARYPTGAGVGQGTGKRGKGTIHIINISSSLFITAT